MKGDRVTRPSGFRHSEFLLASERREDDREHPRSEHPPCAAKRSAQALLSLLHAGRTPLPEVADPRDCTELSFPVLRRISQCMNRCVMVSQPRISSYREHSPRPRQGSMCAHTCIGCSKLGRMCGAHLASLPTPSSRS